MKSIQTIGKHISCVQAAIQVVIGNLQQRSIVHDQSKYQHDELKGFMRFDDMPEGLEYGSDDYKAAMAQIMDGNDCFILHCKRNDHHPEHYEHVQDMPLVALIEMVCDWRGAHDTYGNKGSWADGVDNNIKRWDFTTGQIWAIKQIAQLFVK